MPYSPPTFETLKASVARDLRDADMQTFVEAEVGDLVMAALVEVNRVYPLMQVEDVTLALDDEDAAVYSYTIESREVYRIEVWKDGKFYAPLPESGGDSNSGWDLWGTTLLVPTWLSFTEGEHSLKVFGYQDRDIPDTDDDVLETDAEAEFGIRYFSQMVGYQRLQNDRALFQQWLALPGNNDISPTQLDGMANTYQAQWERYREHMRRLRR